MTWRPTSSALSRPIFWRRVRFHRRALRQRPRAPLSSVPGRPPRSCCQTTGCRSFSRPDGRSRADLAPRAFPDRFFVALDATMVSLWYLDDDESLASRSSGSASPSDSLDGSSTSEDLARVRPSSSRTAFTGTRFSYWRPGTGIFPNFHSFIKPKAMHAYAPEDRDQWGIFIGPRCRVGAGLGPGRPARGGVPHQRRARSRRRLTWRCCPRPTAGVPLLRERAHQSQAGRRGGGANDPVSAAPPSSSPERRSVRWPASCSTPSGRTRWGRRVTARWRRASRCSASPVRSSSRSRPSPAERPRRSPAGGEPSTRYPRCFAATGCGWFWEQEPSAPAWWPRATWVSGVFHLGTPWLVVIIGVTIPGYMATHLLGGVLQGLERFHRFALESVVEGFNEGRAGSSRGRRPVFTPRSPAMAAVLCSCASRLATYAIPRRCR